MRNLVLALAILTAFIDGCQSNETSSEILPASAVESVSTDTNKNISVSKLPILASLRFGAIVIDSRVLTDREMNYKCQIKLVSDTSKAIKAIELVDYRDGGGMPTAYNLRRSVKPLGKMKVQLLSHETMVKSFMVRSSYINPVVAKIFYQDGSIQHTMYDIVGDNESWLESKKTMKQHFISKGGERKSHQYHNDVQEYYNNIELESQKEFHQIDIK